jgi:biopolymer transport protein ExbB
VFNFLNNLAKGGVVMIPLGICSLASLTVLIERFIALRRASISIDALMADIRICLSKGDILGAAARAQAVRGPVAAVLANGLHAALECANPQDAMEEEALAQLPLLQRRLVVLDTVVTIAPLLGLLGTVVGMISSFHILAQSGTDQPAGITGGIAEALIATGTGLVIAIFTLVGFNWCQEKVRTVGSEMERRSAQLVNWLAQMEIKDEVLVKSL